MVVCLLNPTTRISLTELDDDAFPIFSLEKLTSEGWKSKFRYSTLWNAIQGYLLHSLKDMPRNPQIAQLIRKIDILSESVKASVTEAEISIRKNLEDPVQLAVLRGAYADTTDN